MTTEGKSREYYARATGIGAPKLACGKITKFDDRFDGKDVAGVAQVMMNIYPDRCVFSIKCGDPPRTNDYTEEGCHQRMVGDVMVIAVTNDWGALGLIEWMFSFDRSTMVVYRGIE